MIVLIAVKGPEGEWFYRQAVALAPLDQAEVLLVHVVDTGPKRDVEQGRERFMVRRPLAPERAADMLQAEEDRARRALHEGRGVLLEAGVPDSALREVILHGKPNEELRRLAEQQDAALVIVGGRGGKPGPHSLGKTARFLVDHAPHAALLIQPDDR